MGNNNAIRGDVVHIVYDQLSRNYKYEQKAKFLDSRIQIVSIKDADELFRQDGIKLMNVVNLYEGQILMRHPFEPNTYIDANTSPLDLYRDKFEKVTDILSDLGVRSVSGEAEWVGTEKHEIDASGHVKTLPVKIEGNYHNTEIRKKISSIRIKEQYKGVPLTQDMYLQAIERAKRYGLHNDIEVKSYLEKRNPARRNEYIKKELEIFLSSEYSELTNIAFSLNVMNVFKLGGKYQENIETVNTVKIKLVVDF
ncbi:MAG: hypothetical protein II852_08910 [Bacteroidales bacterium]|nr:hypothetical protein [Bacteroidales bacterium]